MNSATPPAGFYTLRRIKELLGLQHSAVMAFIEAGFITPARGRNNEYRFSFQDLVILRMARKLTHAPISSRRLLQSLRSIRDRLPAEARTSKVRMKAIGNQVALRTGDSSWEDASGQVLLDLEAEFIGSEVSALEPAPRDQGPADGTGDGWYNRGCDLESRMDLADAEQAYRRAVAVDPQHAFAYLNLGALLCESDRGEEAVALYNLAVVKCPDSAPLYFNRALALEDMGRFKDALASYEQCLSLDPGAADAHFNAARLHEKLGEAQSAIRHYSSYRRLTQ